MRLGFALARGAAVALCLPGTPRAQRRSTESPVEVTGVSSARTSDKESVVSISADSSLTRAQTWQDGEGFHVVVYKGRTSLPPGRGYKVQRVGDSLEIIVPVKRGSKVTVQPGANRLDLFVNGNLDDEVRASAPVIALPPRASRETTRTRERQSRVEENNTAPAVVSLKPQNVPRDSASRPPLAAKPERAAATVTQFEAPATVEQSSGSSSLNFVPTDNTANSSSSPPIPVYDDALPTAATSVGMTFEPPLVTQAQTIPDTPPPSSSLAFSLMGALLVAALAVVAIMFVVRRRRAAVSEAGTGSTKATATTTTTTTTTTMVADSKTNNAAGAAAATGVFNFLKRDRKDAESNGHEKSNGHSQNGHPQNGHSHVSEGALEKYERRADMRPLAAGLPAVIFGAYRIDQEASKLVSGEAHNIDVLASRAMDDRRAVEASLVKMLRARDTDEANRRRARAALEEYGFVARQSAALLLSSDTYDRVSAARVLGEIKSASALPFLLEALYDHDALVRTEAVASLGALGLPSAIGALIDMARRHPEVPPSLIGPALNACSVEAVEMIWNGSHESRSFALGGMTGLFTGEIIDLDPVGMVEQLPEWLEDETLADALERLESVDVEARIAAAQSLAQFQVQRAVDALSAMASGDTAPAVRAAAVTSLGIINHESVFVPILIALADGSREVCAAAARSLSRLSFERADAYARVIETADDETLRRAAKACVASGMAAKAIDRLASEDRRQAYEAFSMVSLLVRADETKPILHAIETHPDFNVRLVAVRLAGVIQHTELVAQLRQLATRGNVPEDVRAAILEAAYKADGPTLRNDLTGAEMI